MEVTFDVKIIGATFTIIVSILGLVWKFAKSDSKIKDNDKRIGKVDTDNKEMFNKAFNSFNTGIKDIVKGQQSTTEKLIDQLQISEQRHSKQNERLIDKIEDTNKRIFDKIDHVEESFVSKDHFETFKEKCKC